MKDESGFIIGRAHTCSLYTSPILVLRGMFVRTLETTKSNVAIFYHLQPRMKRISFERAVLGFLHCVSSSFIQRHSVGDEKMKRVDQNRMPSTPGIRSKHKASKLVVLQSSSSLHGGVASVRARQLGFEMVSSAVDLGPIRIVCSIFGISLLVYYRAPSLRKEYMRREWTLDHFTSDSEHTYHGHYNYKDKKKKKNSNKELCPMSCSPYQHA